MWKYTNPSSIQTQNPRDKNNRQKNSIYTSQIYINIYEYNNKNSNLYYTSTFSQF